MSYLMIFLRGLLMGAADVVPGVSGGTIAFITGIYSRLVHSISTLNFNFISDFFTGKFKSSWGELKKNDFALFIPLVLGIGLSMFLFSGLVGFLLESYAAYTFAFFFGLILASALFMVKTTRKMRLEHYFFVAAGVATAYMISGTSALMANHSLPIIFLSGAVAICAMILPGISGAFILLLLNQYQYVINAIHNLNFSVIGVFGAGAIIGLLSFSKLLDYLLLHQRKLTFSFLIGIMVGSLRIPWQNIMGNHFVSWIALILGLVGFVLVFTLESVFGKLK